MYAATPCVVNFPASSWLETALEIISVDWLSNDPLTLFSENVKQYLEPVASK